MTGMESRGEIDGDNSLFGKSAEVRGHYLPFFYQRKGRLVGRNWLGTLGRLESRRKLLVGPAALKDIQKGRVRPEGGPHTK